jgi:hypothetical protein
MQAEPRFEAQLVEGPEAEFSVDLECLDLATAAVERDHQLGREPLG